MEERLQKILARAGLGSRRACEEMIRRGEVTVDGNVAQIGQKADPKRDRIALRGTEVAVATEDRVYVAVHKPPGVLSTTRDVRGRPTVRALVPLPGRLYPAGRLDQWSEGLVLLTNDGEMTNKLTHPRYGHTKEYHACLEGHLDDAALERWRDGVFLDGRRTARAEVSILRREGKRTWLSIVLREGRKRQIRRVAAMLGHRLLRLIRVRVGPVRLGNLEPGQWRHLTRQELGQLKVQTRRRRP